MPMATAAAAPLPAGAMVGAAKPSELVEVTESAVASALDDDLVAEAEAEAVAVSDSAELLLESASGGP